MHKHTRPLTFVLVAAMALALGACGNRQGDGGDAAANITFRTDPRGVEVWIDGERAGTTPVVIAVAAGTHEIQLKHDGFEPVKDSLAVEAGKDLTVTSALAVTGSPAERVGALLAALDIPEHANLEPEAHRGTTPPVMLYWPRRDVRKAGLSTWRLEIARYDDDGALVFKKGRTELFRQPLRATGLVMEGALPPAVMEALKPGTRITWGIDFSDKRKKDIMATFVVKDGRSLERKLAKLAGRSVYRRAGALEREIARIELKRNYRFYTEALTDAMSVLNTWPTTQLADKVIADALQRMKLKDSTLYTEIMARLRGAGRAGRGPGGVGDVTAPMPLTLVAPKIAQPTPEAEKAEGLQAGGGLGVTPTGGDQKREPGPIDEGGDDASSGGGTGVAPDERRGARGNLAARELAELTARREALEDAEAAAENASEALQAASEASGAAREALEEAQKAADEAAASGDDAKIDEAQKALEAAQEAEQAAGEAEKAARETNETAQRAADQARQALGDPAAAREREAQLRDQLEGQDDGTAPSRPRDQIERDLSDLEAQQARLEEAQGRLDSASDAATAAGEVLSGAQKAVEDAQEALDSAQEGGDEDAISAARSALEAAQQGARDAAEAAEAARKAEETAQEDLSKAHADGGAAEEVRRREQQLREELDRASGVGSNPLPQQAGAEQAHAEARVIEARRALTRANQAIDTTSKALAVAEADFKAAEHALDAAETGDAGDEAVAEAEAIFQRAQEAVTRAQMEAQRALGDAARATREFEAAQKLRESLPSEGSGD